MRMQEVLLHSDESDELTFSYQYRKDQVLAQMNTPMNTHMKIHLNTHVYIEETIKKNIGVK